MRELTSFTNRVRKNARHWDKWARREGLEAYRIYDCDIPEFPYAVDRYADYLHVQLFEPRRAIAGEAVAAQLDALAETLVLPRANVAFKSRRRQRGSAQYEKTAQDGPSFVVRERDLRFEVNLFRYLDTGLFPDHRNTRTLVAERARGKTVLNLFAYTGSFTVCAAVGGALRTVTVDMSRTYQTWTRRNLEHNGIDDFNRHTLIQDDVMQFVLHAQRSPVRFDLIVLDPPSFSNSKRMVGTFDIQRDHLNLLRQTLPLLAPDGDLWFSTNRRGFRLDEDLAQQAEEITRQTVPPDYQRRLPHRCWILRNA